MTDKITFYHNPMSRGRMVHWMLEEVGAPYETKVLDFEKRDHKSAEYLKINPMGKLPTIVHRGVVVTETPAIIAYLADAFPKAGLAPAVDDPKRGAYYRWLFFGAGCVEPSILDKLFSRTTDEKSKTAIGYGSQEDTFNALEKALTPGPYLLGDKFSAADVYIGSQLGWGMHMKGVDPRPVFQQYYERVSARPASKRANGG